MSHGSIGIGFLWMSLRNIINMILQTIMATRYIAGLRTYNFIEYAVTVYKPDLFIDQVSKAWTAPKIIPG